MNSAGDPITRPSEFRLSFVSCISNEESLSANLLASPCLQPGSPHEAIFVKSCPSAAAGLNLGMEQAQNEYFVCLHQDVYLPIGWDRRLFHQVERARRQFGPIGVAGVYGVGEPRDLNAVPRDEEIRSESGSQPRPDSPRFAVNRLGRVIHRGHKLFDGPELPAKVSTLDELLLVVPRETPLRFDPALGFHLYGADICLQAHERGLAVVALDTACHHNTRTTRLPRAFFRSADVFAR